MAAAFPRVRLMNGPWAGRQTRSASSVGSGQTGCIRGGRAWLSALGASTLLMAQGWWLCSSTVSGRRASGFHQACRLGFQTSLNGGPFKDRCFFSVPSVYV